VYYPFIFTWYQSKWFKFLSVLFVLLAGGQWSSATTRVKSFKDSCLKHLNVHLAFLISVLSTAFSLLSIVCCRLPPLATCQRLSNLVHPYLKIPTPFFLNVQQCEPLFSISAPLSTAFHRRLPITVAVSSSDHQIRVSSSSDVQPRRDQGQFPRHEPQHAPSLTLKPGACCPRATVLSSERHHASFIAFAGASFVGYDLQKFILGEVQKPPS